MSSHRIQRALISVYDKTGIVDFVRALSKMGIEIISTGGTASLLKSQGVSVTLVEDITGFSEMLDGRVKTLHPRIHAAILADRDNPEHRRQLAEQGIKPIDMVVVSLYPFEKTISNPDCTFEQAIEMIDIGGPCLLRAAAKNHRHVAPIIFQPAEAGALLDQIQNFTGSLFSPRQAAKCFYETLRYDKAVSDYLQKQVEWSAASPSPEFAPNLALLFMQTE